MKICNAIGIIETIKTELFNKYGEVDGDSIVILPKNIESFNKEYNELYTQECEIEYKPINIELLKDITEQENFNILYKLVIE